MVRQHAQRRADRPRDNVRHIREILSEVFAKYPALRDGSKTDSARECSLVTGQRDGGTGRQGVMLVAPVDPADAIVADVIPLCS
jgi:hypothetical protein